MSNPEGSKNKDCSKCYSYQLCQIQTQTGCVKHSQWQPADGKPVPKWDVATIEEMVKRLKEKIHCVENSMLGGVPMVDVEELDKLATATKEGKNV